MNYLLLIEVSRTSVLVLPWKLYQLRKQTGCCVFAILVGHVQRQPLVLGVKVAFWRGLPAESSKA